MPDIVVNERVRLFGKMPAHGDFVSRGMPAAARAALDHWLAGQIDGQSILGAEFGSLYDRAPPWRFTWPATERMTAGALAPSMDAAGRRYPIVLALAGLDASEAESAAAACEALLYDALSGRWHADRLADAAATIAPVAGPSPGGAARWWTTDERGRTFELAGTHPDGLFAALLHLREEDA